MTNSERPNYLQKIRDAFARHGYLVKTPVLDAGRKLTNTTSLFVTHVACGCEKKNSISFQKAQHRNFKLCPICDGVHERIYEWTFEQICVEAKNLIHSTVIGRDDGARYARNSPKPAVKTEIEVKCDVCGYQRPVTLQTLFKGKGNGCPKCAGNAPNDAVTVVARAQEYGLKILNSEVYKGGSTELEFECVVCGHKFSQTWQNQRKRGCGNCKNHKRPFGEILLQAICKHYFPRVECLPNFKVVGLVPGEPDTPVFYDLACPEMKIALENHSAYHVADKFTFAGCDITEKLDRRKKLDIAKQDAVTQQNGKMKDWRYGEVWFELDKIKRLPVDINGSYIPAVVEQFKAVMKKCGINTPNIQPPSPADLFSYFSTYNNFFREAQDHGFEMLVQDWKGRTDSYNLLHSCGKAIMAIPCEIETKWSRGETGCDWCDKSGRMGSWRQFIDLVAKRGWRIQNPLILRSEGEEVTFVCEHHSEHGVQTALRKDLREECRENASNLPTCPSCRQEITDQRRVLYKGKKIQEILVKFNEELQRNGLRLIEWEWKGTAHKGCPPSKYLVECMHCLNSRPLLVHQTLEKLKRRATPSRGCPACNRKWKKLNKEC